MKTGEFPLSIPDLTEELIKIGVIQHPDPVLSKIADAVEIKRDELQFLFETLSDSLNKVSSLYDFTNGIGIAAPQLGISKRAVLFGDRLNELIFVANPNWVATSTENDKRYEGCLSCWKCRGLVRRQTSVEVEGFDQRGNRINLCLRYVLARMAQHECDHLNGIIYPQRMDSGDSLIDLKQYETVKRSRHQPAFS